MLQESYALGLIGKGTFEELVLVAQDREKPNWDGYGAEPVTYDVYLSAYRFLEAGDSGRRIARCEVRKAKVSWRHGAIIVSTRRRRGRP